MKLVLDEMLKRTAKWLRVFGVDADYIKPNDDDELLAYARKNKRVLITKDKELAKKCEKRGAKFLFLEGCKIEEQLAQIKNELKIEFPFPEKTRCTSCNAELKLVSKEEVSDIVPENVLKHHKKFWLCKKCNKAYWKGSHWRNIMRIYKAIKS